MLNAKNIHQPKTLENGEAEGKFSALIAEFICLDRLSLELRTITFISLWFRHLTPPSAVRAYFRCPPIQSKTKPGLHNYGVNFEFIKIRNW